MANQQRTGRLAQEIQRDISDILLKRVRDPRIVDVTITDVDVTADFSYATVYFSVLSDLASVNQKAEAGLEAAKGLIRKELGSRLQIYKIPELRFVKDESVKYGNHIEELLRNLNKD